jgi:hypothetical protein
MGEKWIGGGGAGALEVDGDDAVHAHHLRSDNMQDTQCMNTVLLNIYVYMCRYIYYCKYIYERSSAMMRSTPITCAVTICMIHTCRMSWCAWLSTMYEQHYAYMYILHYT